MKMITSYSVKIKQYNNILKATVSLYRNAVDYFVDVCLAEWETIAAIDGMLKRKTYIEQICHKTAANPTPKYKFDSKFYKLPSYLRRSAIAEALGKVTSYRANLTNWKNTIVAKRGKKPSKPRAGDVYPCLYREGMYNQLDTYTAQIKVFIRNTWDWLTVELKKSDIDYILRHCAYKTQCAPVLRKRGHEWFLDFAFIENAELNDTAVHKQIAVAVDLGINSAAAVSVMSSDGTILGRHFLKLSSEYDSLNHAINRIKKAQQHRNHRTPRLFARANGINEAIAVHTAEFIVSIAAQYSADVIVFEHLDMHGKIKGSKKQKLHLWRCQYVQTIVANKAHRLGMRMAHVCAWGTSKLAFDGSGVVARGNAAGQKSHSICKFQNGKTYNCDLNASYNIGARYFIREIIKPLPVTTRSQVEAKVPSLERRTSCTLATLRELNSLVA